MNVVYVVEVYFEIFGYFRLYPHFQIICSNYESAKKQVDIEERLLYKNGYKRVSTNEEIRAEKPYTDVYLENHWSKIPMISQKVIIDTWAVL